MECNKNSNIFTKEEICFIERHGLSLNDFYDGRHQSKDERHDCAKAYGCNYVIGPHCRYGHRLRTRSGHCIICDPSKIAFQKRHNRSGLVYVAHSETYTKVGVVDNNIQSAEEAIHNREIRLNAEGGYGGENNWKIIAWTNANDELGRVEEKIHNSLSDYSIEADYMHSGVIHTAKELFTCTPDYALKMAEKIFPSKWVYDYSEI